MQADPAPVGLPAAVRQVLVFSGHRVDAPQRRMARFPPGLVTAVERRIGDELDRLGAGAEDVALSQAAAGSDLLFIECCLRRRVACRVLLPEPESDFIERSVLTSCDGSAWQARWQAARRRLEQPPQILPDPAAGDRYQRCNRWLLASAVAAGAERLRVLVVWNGADSDGTGGVPQLIAEARRHTGHITWIDTRALRSPQAAP